MRKETTSVTINVLQLYSSWTGWWANNWWWNLASLGCWKSYPAGSCAGLPLICCNFVGAFLHGLWVGKEMIHFSLPDTKWNSSLLRPRTRESRAWVWVDWARDLQQKQCASVRSGFGAFFLTIRLTASSIGTSKLWHHCVAGKCCRLHQIATIGLQGLCDEVRCKTFSSLPDCFWVLEGLEWQFCSSSSKAKVKWMECSGFQN